MKHRVYDRWGLPPI